MHIHIVHRAIRIHDNTSLIYQLKNSEKSVQVIFIFTPEQIKPSENKYFSNGSVQFMIESLNELSDEIKEYNGRLQFFYGDNLKVLKDINRITKIESISFNYEYTPYGRKRSKIINDWAKDNNIIIYEKEDYVLYDILTGDTLKKDKTPYLVYTPYMHHLINDLEVRPIDKFNKFKFIDNKELHKSKYYLEQKEINKFYTINEDINVNGGRSNTLKILKNIDDFKDYQKKKDFLTYKTTFLGPSNHFGTASIREVYYAIRNKLGKNHGLIRELIWRQFYMELCHHFPKVLQGQIKSHNLSLKEKYDKIQWENDKKLFEKWASAKTGIPIVDASVRQLLKKNFVHNRCRMISACFVVKDLLIDWKICEKFYASKLVDYDPMVNNMSWQWVAGMGADAQPYFRIFNPWTQAKKYDKDAEYIKEYIPELRDVPAKDIHNWFDPEIREYWKSKGIKYYDPIVDHSEQRKKIIKLYKKALY